MWNRLFQPKIHDFNTQPECNQENHILTALKEEIQKNTSDKITHSFDF